MVKLFLVGKPPWKFLLRHLRISIGVWGYMRMRIIVRGRGGGSRPNPNPNLSKPCFKFDYYSLVKQVRGPRWGTLHVHLRTSIHKCNAMQGIGSTPALRLGY